MSKFFYISVLLLAVVVFGSCGGGDDSMQVAVSWNANRDKVVNTTGGGYILYYSQSDGFDVSDAQIQKVDVPYASGPTAPTSTSLTLSEGVWYLRVSAYGATQHSEPCDQITVNVGG